MKNIDSQSQTGTHISVIIPNWLLNCIDRTILDKVLQKSTEEQKLFKLTRSQFIIDSIMSANAFQPESANVIQEPVNA